MDVIEFQLKTSLDAAVIPPDQLVIQSSTNSPLESPQNASIFPHRKFEHIDHRVMRLYLKPDDPSHTELTATSGHTYYRVVSDSSLHRSSVSRLRVQGNRPLPPRRESIYAGDQRRQVGVGTEGKQIALLTWQCLGGGRVRTGVFEKDGVERNVGFKDLLWKKVMFSR